MITKMKMIFAAALMLAVAPVANAQSEASPDLMGFVGISLGYADPTSINGRFGLGGDAGLMFKNGIMASLFYRTSKAAESKHDVRVDHYAVGADYSLAKLLPGPFGGFRGGIRVGASTMDEDSYSGIPKYNDTAFMFGPSLGYDLLHLPYNFSAGAGADLLFTMGDSQYATLYVTANLKYWF